MVWVTWGSGRTAGGSDPGPRSVTPIVGLILLIGLVFVGVVIVAGAGTMLLDALEQESQVERAESAIDATDHGITTAIQSGDPTAIPWGDARYVDDGELTLVWFDADREDLDPADPDDYANTTVDIEPLGAIEYQVDDRTVAYQAGGRFTSSDGATSVASPPPVSYDEDGLQLRVVTLSEADVESGDEVAVQPNADPEHEAEIDAARANASEAGYGDLGVVVTSEYHDGWERHLEESLVGEDVDVGGDLGLPNAGEEATVQAVIENATPVDPPVQLVDDRGLAGEDDHAEQNRFVYEQGEPLEFEVEVENTGGERLTREVFVDVGDASISRQDRTTETTLDPDENRTVTISIPHDAYREELAFGETYDYEFGTQNDRSHSGGEFYYTAQADPSLEVSSLRVQDRDASDGDDPVGVNGSAVNVSADVHNLGATNASEVAGDHLELDLVPYVDEDRPEVWGNESWYAANQSTFDVGYGATERASWSLNRSLLLQGDHEAVVSTTEDVDGSEATGHLTVESGVDVGDTELFLGPDTAVNVSVVGSEMSSYCDFLCQGRPFNRWLPTDVDVYTQPVDEDDDPITEEPDRHDQADGLQWADRNLNVHDDRLEIFEYSFTTDERVSLMLQATSYVGCDEWTHRDQVDGYDIYDCPTGDEQDPLVDLTAETDTEESNVRVLNETRNTMPELDPGVHVQKRADELLTREGVDIEVSENEDPDVYDGEGYDLHLDEHEYVFLFELTHHPEQYNEGPELSDPDPEDRPDYWTNERYWAEAFDRQGDDPNFNDVIAHVEIDPGEAPANTSLIAEATPDGDGTPVSPDSGLLNPDERGHYDDVDVDVGTDEIIIGG